MGEKVLLPDQDVEKASRPTALIHILTPEFHGFNPDDFNDISDDVVLRASADDLQPYLYRPYVRKFDRQSNEVSSFSYQTADEGFVTVALTPEEYSTGSESIDKLAERRFHKVLAQRDAKKRTETGDENARARDEEDFQTAERGAMRSVMKKQADMEELLEQGILPKIDLIERFIEMTRGNNPNLARGSRDSVSERFETLRTTVFDDMLDAVAVQRGWKSERTERAKAIIQKRLYISGTSRERIINFREMLDLAERYYGYKRALILTKIEDTKRYRRARPEVIVDILQTDEVRRQEKETKIAKGISEGLFAVDEST